jgi:hypothetical protein
MRMDASAMPEMKGRDIPPEVAARMGDHTSRICRGADSRDMIKKSKDMKDCDIKDFKESGTSLSMKVDCKKESRKADITMTYNKARTSYSGTVHMTDARGHDMTMNMSGKKIGTCDLAKAEQEKAERHAQIDRFKAQAAESQARAKAYTEQAQAAQIANCDKAVAQMDPDGLGYFGMCYSKKDDANCKMMLSSFGGGENAAIGKACTAKAAEFCRRYQSTEGFLALNKNGKLSGAEQMCGVSAEDLKPRLCKSAVKSGSYEFLAYNCPKDAAPLAKQHCAGRSYTSSDPRAKSDKWYRFCVAMAGRSMEGDTTASSSSGGGDSSSDEADAKGAAKKAAKKAAVNALKGLFGR